MENGGGNNPKNVMSHGELSPRNLDNAAIGFTTSNRNAKSPFNFNSADPNNIMNKTTPGPFRPTQTLNSGESGNLPGIAMSTHKGNIWMSPMSPQQTAQHPQAPSQSKRMYQTQQQIEENAAVVTDLNSEAVNKMINENDRPSTTE